MVTFNIRSQHSYTATVTGQGQITVLCIVYIDPRPSPHAQHIYFFCTCGEGLHGDGANSMSHSVHPGTGICN